MRVLQRNHGNQCIPARLLGEIHVFGDNVFKHTPLEVSPELRA
jgi:hypothetical protein